MKYPMGTKLADAVDKKHAHARARARARLYLHADHRASRVVDRVGG